MARSAYTPSSSFLVTLAVLLALTHAVLAVTATVEKSLTSDEIAHLTAGTTYNRLGDYRMQPENGNLPQRWAALPATISAAPLPPTNSEAWRTSNVWHYGHAFYYEQRLPADILLFEGRVMIALFSAATGLLIFFWARALFGWKGAFVSLVLFVFCPAFLAHGALVTSDIVMTFFFLAAMAAWWRHLEQPGITTSAVSVVVFGLACVSKFSAPLLPVMFALASAVWLILRARSVGWKKPLAFLIRTALVHAVGAWLVIWLFYGFRFSPFAPALAEGASYNHGWGWMLQDLGWSSPIIRALKRWQLLPDSFLYGFTFVLQFAKQRGAFLNGDYSLTGWFTFFPYAFLVKTTLPLLLLFAAGAVVTLRSYGIGVANSVAARVRPFTPLLALFVVYWVTSLLSHLNIGHRHLLPTYPVLFIIAGALGAWLDWRRPAAFAALALLVCWHGFESSRIRPHYLAYFNPLAGGAQNGWRHLVDSSLDWGQDLPGLKKWLAVNAKHEPVFLSYFGTADPIYEGIQATALPSLPAFGPERKWTPLGPGVYAVSATMLQHVYSPIRGDWTLELEKEFQAGRGLEPVLIAYQNEPARRTELLKEAPAAKWETAWARYELLRFARLCHFLRVRTPDANIGYSILIYRLTGDEVKGAIGGSARDWQKLIERTVTADH